MANPWTKKNPVLSMWLSGVNAIAGKVRAAGAAESKRQQKTAATQATRYWRDAWLAALKSKRPR